MNNLGSFGSAIGGMSPELQAAVSRRAGGNPSGPLGQTTQTAPTNNPAIQQSPLGSTPAPVAGSRSVGLPPTPPSAGTGPGLPMNTPESELIVKALANRLNTLGKLQGA
jgi:hypothetical protein